MTIKLLKIGFYGIKFFVHVSSIGFAILASFHGDWTECIMFATFAFMTA